VTDPAAVLRARAVADPLAFAKLSPNTVPLPFARFHRDLVAWPDTPGTMQARIVFRGAAKTTLTRMLVLWAIITRRTAGVLWIRATSPDADADRQALERLAAMFGLECEVRAREQLVIVAGVPVWTKSPRNTVRGVTYTRVDGTVIRPTHVIVDDVETEESARSKTQTAQLERFLFSAAFETGTGGRPVSVIMLGTPLSPTALISKAIRREPPFDTWTDPLVVPVVDADGRPAWPDNYDPTRRDRVPAITWATEQLLETVPANTLYFPPDRTVWRPTPPARTVTVGVDPAGDGEDATGMAAVCRLPADDLSPLGSLHTVAARAWNGRAADAPTEVAAFCRHVAELGHRVGLVFVEANNGPWSFMVDEIAAKVAPIDVQFEAPVLSKAERALPFTLWQQLGQWSFDPALRGTEADTETHTFTVDQLTVSGHDDVFDAIMWAAGVETEGATVRPTVPQGD